MMRLPNWRRRLKDFIDRVRKTPLDYEHFDCGPAWAGELVRELTGEDPAAPFRGRYKSRAGALRVMRATGHADLASLVSTLLPAWEHASQARVGDLVAVPTPGPFGYSLGICNGATIFVLRDDGVGVMDLLAASHAWRVGDA